MKKKLLITGASGFVGYHLVQVAKEAGFEVHAAVRASSKIDDIREAVDKFVYPDLSKKTDLEILFAHESYDYVIHAAALTKAKFEADMFDVNVNCTLNILEAAFSTANPPKRIHFVSSLAAIGPLHYGSGEITEETEYSPVTAYGRSKRVAEIQIRERFADKPISVFRPTAVYGPKDKDIFILLKTMNKGLDAYIGKKPQKLSFIYVKDLAHVLVDSLDIDVDGLQFYNVSDGNSYGRYEFADIFRRIVKRRMLRLHVSYGLVRQVARFSQWLYKSSPKTPVIYPERLNELTAENWSCNISKAKSELGFVPKYDLEKGLKESLAWYKTHLWL